MKNKKTLVIGASVNPARYSFKAINSLRSHGHDVVALGLKEGKVSDVNISKEIIKINDIHTVTLYVGPRNQTVYYNYIESLKPERVIFNPGTENPEFEEKLRSAGINVMSGCTLVMLSTNQY